MFGKTQDVNFTLLNGQTVKSNVSGFVGVITSRADHLNGCNRYFVSPSVDKDGKLPDGYWFDEAELEVIEEPKVERKNNDRGGFPGTIK